MKIALYHNLSSGGSKREAYEFAKQMVRAGHTLLSFCPSTADEQFLPLSSIAHQSFTFDLPQIPPLPIRITGLTRYIDLVALLINLRRQKQLAMQIAAKIDSEHCDFVFVHHDQIAQAPYLLRYLKTPSAYYCAEPMRKFYEPGIERPYDRPRTAIDRAQRNWYAPARWFSRAVVIKENFRNVQSALLLLTNSFYSAEAVYRAYGKRAVVSYLGVDVEKFRPMNLERQNFVLSVGAISPLKGYDFLIQAIANVPQEIRPKLVIVGNTAASSEQAFLTDLATRARVELEFRIDVTEDELVVLYNRARVFAYSPVLEPFGLAVVEAMACSTPVVAVKEGGVRESVRDGETGLLVPRETHAFARALQCLLEDRHKSESLGTNGRNEVLRFWMWDKAYERLMENVQALRN